MNRLGFNANGITHFAQKTSRLFKESSNVSSMSGRMILSGMPGKARTGAYVDNFRILFF